nr:hypothetical protein GCM10020093_042050 [Planobispora longispora]
MAADADDDGEHRHQLQERQDRDAGAGEDGGEQRGHEGEQTTDEKVHQPAVRLPRKAGSGGADCFREVFLIFSFSIRHLLDSDTSGVLSIGSERRVFRCVTALGL